MGLAADCSVLLTTATVVGMGVAVGWGVAVGKGVLVATGAVGTLVTAGVAIMQAESSAATINTAIAWVARAELFLFGKLRRRAAPANR